MVVWSIYGTHEGSGIWRNVSLGHRWKLEGSGLTKTLSCEDRIA